MTKGFNALPDEHKLSKLNLALLSLSLLWLGGGVGYKLYYGSKPTQGVEQINPIVSDIASNQVATMDNQPDDIATNAVSQMAENDQEVITINPNGYAETAYVQQHINVNNGKLRIGLFGDSMADGLWAGLMKETATAGQQDKISIYKFSKQGTGLANYEYANMHDKAVSQIAQKPIDIAIIAVGANDQRGITGAGGSVPYGSPKWAGRYSERVDELAKVFIKKGIPVYWVGLPIIKNDESDKLAQQLCRIYHDRAADNNITFISIYKDTAGRNGKFSGLLTIPGESISKHLRAPDGVHFTTDGYRIMAIPVIKTLNRDLKSSGFEIKLLSANQKN